MPVYECARCNNLTYSASRFTSIECDLCGGTRHRALEHAFSFEEARDEPRRLTPGDHVCVTFDTPDDVAPLCAHIIRSGLAENARVIAYPQDALATAITAILEPAEADAVEWQPADSIYGPGFDPDDVIEHFRLLAASEDRPLYIVGGSQRPFAELCDDAAFRRFEQGATEAAIDLGMVVVCLYERELQRGAHLDAGEETHPLASEDGAPVKRNERFVFAG
jgi:hypothetical protein